MTHAVDHTQLHRTAKYFMDSGRAETHEDAVRLLQSFGLSIRIDARTAATVNGQVALLTLVNAARRTFLAGIEIAGLPNIPLIAPLASADTLPAAVAELGGRLVTYLNHSWPVALIGNGDGITNGAPVWQLSWSGWRCGVTPARLGKMPTEESAIPLAPAIAAAACIAEAFAYHAGDHPMAGKRAAGMSLWMPGRNWLGEDPSEPGLAYLPSRLWLIGMGNLGQAFAWLLATLPYADRQAVELVLQDFDRLAVSNDSTSLLSTLSAVGQKKDALQRLGLRPGGSPRCSMSTALEQRRGGDLMIPALLSAAWTTPSPAWRSKKQALISWLRPGSVPALMGFATLPFTHFLAGVVRSRSGRTSSRTRISA